MSTCASPEPCVFTELLAKIATAFDRAGLAYMVIGGQAVLLHGEPRLTRDVDVTLGVPVDRLSDVLAAVAGIPLEPLVEPESFVPETWVLPCRDAASDLRVDLIFSDSAYERAALGRAESRTLTGVAVRFASAEDLVVHKVLAGRPRDLEDVRGVLLKNPGLDRKLIRDALRQLGAAIDEDLVARFDTIDRAG
jgi:hypothetical protein